MSPPDRTDEPEQIELPPPRPTLLQRLALWVQHAHALKGWVQGGPRSLGGARRHLRDDRTGFPHRRRHARRRTRLPTVPVRASARALRRLRPRAAGERDRVRAEADHELRRPGRGRHQAGREHHQGQLELVGRPRLVLPARLRDESPAPGDRDRPLSGLGAFSRVGQGASPLARSLRRSARGPTLPRRRRRRRQPPDRDRRNRHTRRLGLRPRRTLADRLTPAAPLRRPLDRPDPRIAPLRGRLHRLAALQRPHPRPPDPGEDQHLRRARDCSHVPARLLPVRPRDRRRRRPQRHPLRTPLSLHSRRRHPRQAM